MRADKSLSSQWSELATEILTDTYQIEVHAKSFDADLLINDTLDGDHYMGRICPQSGISLVRKLHNSTQISYSLFKEYPERDCEKYFLVTVSGSNQGVITPIANRKDAIRQWEEINPPICNENRPRISPLDSIVNHLSKKIVSTSDYLRKPDIDRIKNLIKSSKELSFTPIDVCVGHWEARAAVNNKTGQIEITLVSANLNSKDIKFNTNEGLFLMSGPIKPIYAAININSTCGDIRAFGETRESSPRAFNELSKRKEKHLEKLDNNGFSWDAPSHP